MVWLIIVGHWKHWREGERFIYLRFELEFMTRSFVGSDKCGREAIKLHKWLSFFNSDQLDSVWEVPRLERRWHNAWVEEHFWKDATARSFLEMMKLENERKLKLQTKSEAACLEYKFKDHYWRYIWYYKHKSCKAVHNWLWAMKTETLSRYTLFRISNTTKAPPPKKTIYSWWKIFHQKENTIWM